MSLGNSRFNPKVADDSWFWTNFCEIHYKIYCLIKSAHTKNKFDRHPLNSSLIHSKMWFNVVQGVYYFILFRLLCGAKSLNQLEYVQAMQNISFVR